MNDKNKQRHMAYEAMMVLLQIALLTFIIRLWPILLLMILGIFVAALRLLFLSSKKIEPVKPMEAFPPSAVPPTEPDMEDMAYFVIQRRITQILQEIYPDVRWIWENPCAKEDIIAGNPVYVLLNKAGGYRRGRVVIRNLHVFDVSFADEKKESNDPVPPPEDAPKPAPPATPPTDDDNIPENYGLIAFQWVEAHVMELNDRCNEAIGEGLTEYLIPASELPVSESWEEICKELIRNDLHGAQCCDEGIIIEFEQ
jgi:hypothetical protein